MSNATSTPLVRAIRAYRQLNLAGLPHERLPRVLPKRALQLTPVQVGCLVQRYNAGATVYELAPEFGIGRQTVSKYLKAAGVQFRLSSLTEAEVEEVIWLYGTGLSLAKVGERVGREASLIHLTLRREGITCRDSHGRERSCSSP